MALMIGALMIQGIQPGPQVMTKQPELFWGVIASMWIGNLMLIIINLPLIGIWVSLLRVPYHLLFPAIVVFCAIGAYSIGNSLFDLWLMLGFGFIGYFFIKIGVEPAPFVLGFVLGPMLEENFRRAMLIASGDFFVFRRAPDQRRPARHAPRCCWRPSWFRRSAASARCSRKTERRPCSLGNRASVACSPGNSDPGIPSIRCAHPANGGPVHSQRGDQTWLSSAPTETTICPARPRPTCSSPAAATTCSTGAAATTPSPTPTGAGRSRSRSGCSAPTAAPTSTVRQNIAGNWYTFYNSTDTLRSIENVVGSRFADTITGNEQDNILIGLGGGDTLDGGGGTDTVELRGVRRRASSSTCPMGFGQGGHAEGDSYQSIENVVGSAFADTLMGSSAANKLQERRQNDILQRPRGRRPLEGGDGQRHRELPLVAGERASINFDRPRTGNTGSHALRRHPGVDREPRGQRLLRHPDRQRRGRTR